jgi:hypothetical protein
MRSVRTSVAIAALLIAGPAVACTSLEALISPEYYRGLAGDDSQLGDLLSSCFWKGLAEQVQRKSAPSCAAGTHSVGNGKCCADGMHADSGECSPDGRHVVAPGTTCPDGTHAEGPKCIKDGSHSVNGTETCEDGSRYIGDHKCQKDDAAPSAVTTCPQGRHLSRGVCT